MIEEDEAFTYVVFNGDPNTVMTHKSTEIIDPEFGNRSCTLVFKGDNMAYEVDDNGNRVRVLPAISTRASEFTTPESMPAVLPPTSAYTLNSRAIVTRLAGCNPNLSKDPSAAL
jgi:hypothetical protein